MKKNIVLVMVVLALLVAPAFADPTFSGEFKYTMVYDLDDDAKTADQPWEKVGSKASIAFGTDLDDFTSVTAEMKADEDKEVKVQNLILSQDLTGVLGIEGPVTFSYKLGVQDYEVQNNAIMGDADAKVGTMVVLADDATADNPRKGSDSKLFGFVSTIGIMDVLNIDVVAYPETLLDDMKNDEEFGVNVYGTFGPVALSAYYVKSVPFEYRNGDNDDDLDNKGDMAGFNSLVTFSDNFSASVLVEARLEDKGTDVEGSKAVEKTTTKAGVAAAYTLGGLTTKLGADVAKLGADDFDLVDNLDVDLILGYALDTFNAGFELKTSLDDFAAESSAKVKFDYTIADAKFFASAKAKTLKDFKAEEDLAYDFGVSYAAGAATFNVGYANGADTLDTIDKNHDNGVFFQVVASF